MDSLVTVCSRSTNVIMVWAWMLWLSYALGTRMELCFGHGCSGERIFEEHERYYGLGIDSLVTVCSRNTNVIMVWAWILWSPYVLGTRTLLWFGHGCSGYRAQSHIDKRNAWYTQYFGPVEHLECVDRPMQATSGEVGQACIFCAFTLRRSQ